ncbi:acetate/propionate family kinase [Candidatus Sulcia muelleri]|uniref:acetate/propionate family kinase n=1 Tax=Candidatus Karelsulcia muelleri TaxID=336810 RepID=UPI000BC4BDE4|nr:acetate/propionate family kinase [Candidatus Karelsulcia muelleri]NHU72386.1 acetate/propionate family kinase [Candidatus Karelsulcia muelleri]
MKLLILNLGSSSIKYQLLENNKFLIKGLIERIGMSGSRIKQIVFNKQILKKSILNKKIDNHFLGIKKIKNLLCDEKVITEEIYAIGHRIVHGGYFFSKPTIISDNVKKKIKKLFNIAPIHNYINYMGIKISEKIFKTSIQVAVFDTEFHSTIPKKSYLYAIPDEFYLKHYIRSYGFHGISHKFVSKTAIQYLKNKKVKLITMHLGNGSSVTAINSGKSVETSMGFSPNSGLIMGTRSGDIDSNIIFHALKKGFKIDELIEILNKKSGMLALSGSSDMRDIKKKYEKGEKKAILAYEMYAYRVKKYIGISISVMNGVDALIFTGGIGENDILMRKLICKDLDFFGIKLDKKKNNFLNEKKNVIEIQKQNNKVKILVIKTNEELQISEDILFLLKKKN